MSVYDLSKRFQTKVSGIEPGTPVYILYLPETFGTRNELLAVPHREGRHRIEKTFVKESSERGGIEVNTSMGVRTFSLQDVKQDTDFTNPRNYLSELKYNTDMICRAFLTPEALRGYLLERQHALAAAFASETQEIADILGQVREIAKNPQPQPEEPANV